jgi:putative glutamine amidotransferase
MHAARSHRPLVAVVGRHTSTGDVQGWPSERALAVPASLIESLHRAGAAEAALLPTAATTTAGAHLLETDRVDGLMLIGGPDIDPSTFGQERSPQSYGIDPVRDRYELDCLEAAMARGIPVLAICRGMQLLNIACGGTLHQHLPSVPSIGDHGHPTRTGPVEHDVDVVPGTRLADALQVARLSVSSFHHQGIDRVGTGLEVSARSADGLPEAMELADGWIVGVQWHPEHAAELDTVQQRLVDRFVREAHRRLAQVSPIPAPAGAPAQDPARKPTFEDFS